MKILIFTHFYVPDLGPSAPLFGMLSSELVKLGHDVTVIAAVPHYPSGKVQESYKGKFSQRSVEEGVSVVRIRVPSLDRSNLFQRYLQMLIYQVGSSIASLKEKYDAVFVPNPGMNIWLPFFVSNTLRRIPAIFSVHDLYPHVGISLGIFKNRFVINTVAWLEKYCMKNSEYVRILTESFRPGMRELSVPDDKLVLLYDWVDTQLIQPMSHDNSFSREHDLVDKFVVMYAGNIGLSQGLEHVLSAAKLLRDQEDIQFVLIGNGAAREPLQKQVQQEGITNVRFIPFQPRERLPEVLATADISLVPLRHGVGMTALPSKTYSIFASGRPIIASVDAGCETAKLIEQSGGGVCIEPESPEALVEKILYLKNHTQLREQMGARGRDWAEKKHSPRSAAREIERLYQQVLAS